jgi:hypothetical protein
MVLPGLTARATTSASRSSSGIDWALTRAAEHGVRIEPIERGKPTRNGFIAPFNVRGIQGCDRREVQPLSGPPLENALGAPYLKPHGVISEARGLL